MSATELTIDVKALNERFAGKPMSVSEHDAERRLGMKGVICREFSYGKDNLICIVLDDGSRLNLVLQEVTDNVLYAMSEGGTRITLCLASRDVFDALDH